MIVGVVSDTHGLLRSALLKALADVDRIMHCGDVGDPQVLSALKRIAPVNVVRGNVDTYGPCAQLPETEVVHFAGKYFYLLHNKNMLDLNPVAAGFDAVLTGHTHKPLIEYKRGVLYLNPGSCGPKRFALPISYARVTIPEKGKMTAEILELS
jgi:hypothetical protein